MPTFDINVFDPGVFDATYATPVLFKVLLERELSHVSAGQSVSFFAYIISRTGFANKAYPLNTQTTPQVQLYNPNKSIKVAFANMVNIDFGVYQYEHQTNVGDQVGTYTAVFKGVNGDKTMLSLPVALFSI